MAEGGVFPWKVQKLKSVPICDYSSLAEPLPPAPKGYVWFQDKKTREWQLIQVATPSQSEEDHDCLNVVAVAEIAVPVEEDGAHVNDYAYQDGVVYHKVQKTDTLQGLCIRYKVTPTQIRQWNKFSGSNLLLAPDILIMRLNENQNVGEVNTNPSANSKANAIKEKNVQSFLLALENKFGSSLKKKRNIFSAQEASAYIDMYNGDVNIAIQNAIQDIEWENSNETT